MTVRVPFYSTTSIVDNFSIKQRVSTSSTVVRDQYTYNTMPVLAYILRPTELGIQILWRYTGDIPAGNYDQRNSGQQLFEDFKNLAKKRP
jgi:hypothetical protein